MLEEIHPSELIRSIYGFDISQVQARWLTPSQVSNLLSVMPPRDRVFFGVLAETGAKPGEILSLKREDVVQSRALRLPRRVTPLSEDLAVAISALEGEVLFGMSSRTIQRLIRKHGEMVGLPHLRCHDLRTSFAVRFLAAGGQITELATLLGYRDASSVVKLLRFRSEGELFHPPPPPEVGDHEPE